MLLSKFKLTLHKLGLHNKNFSMSTSNDTFQEYQAFVLPKNTKVTQEIISELDNMLSFTPPQ